MSNEQEEQQEQEVQVEDQAQSQEEAQAQEKEVVNTPPQREVAEPEGKSSEERAAEIDHIMSMAESDPSIKDLPEYQAMVEEMKAIDESKTQATQEKEESDSDEKKSVEDEQEKEEDEEEDDDISSDLSDEDDVFGFNRKGKKGKSKYKFKDEKDVVALIKKKGFKEAPTFFESVDKWRNDSQQLVDVLSKNEQIEQGLSSLPTPIKNAIQAFSKSEDWRSAFQSSATNVDFSKDFQDLNKEEVVKHYFKEKYEKLQKQLDEEYYDKEEYEDRINDFYESSERLFDNDKQAIEKRRAEIIDKQNQESEDFKESAISSVKALKEKYPNFNARELQKVKQHLVNGTTESLFVNDSKYSEDAAERVAFALFGNKILKARIAKAKRTGSNESKEEFFQRGNKTVKTTNSQQGFNEKRANDAASHLKGQFKKDPYS